MANLPNCLSIFNNRLIQCNSSKHLKRNTRLRITALTLLLSLPTIALAADSDNDGLKDAFETKIGLEAYLSDTDGDTIKDGDEVGKNPETPLDTDNDGIINALDYDDDNDGLPTYLESKKDSDKDGLLDYLDKDSDNDGITDGEEAGFLNQDKNNDGVDDAFDVNREGAKDANGDGIDDNVKLPDHDNDGKPDYLDPSYKNSKRILVKKETKNGTEKVKSKAIVAKNSNKEITKEKVAEATKKAFKQSDTKQAKVKVKKIAKKTQTKPATEAIKSKPKLAKADDMIINRHTDSDNDGLSNSLEKILGTNHLSRDSDGDKVSDAIEIGMDINAPQDSDRDGIIDALDDDDDNDGVLTKFEDLNKDSTAINDDTDSDGVPNYLDANDDGDALLTKAEGSTKDTDGDGILDYLDKNDGIKNIANAKNKAADKTNQKMPTEPEIVVLFDGDAAALTAQEDEALQEPSTEDVIQDSILSSLDELIQEPSASDTVDKSSAEPTKTATSTNSTTKKTASPWNLF